MCGNGHISILYNTLYNSKPVFKGVKTKDIKL